MNTLSIYIHVPFCSVKCSYCAFNVYIHLNHLIEPFVDSLLREIEIVGQSNPDLTVHTIYFGGGTPTLLSPSQFESILHGISRHFRVLDDVEISTEANPDDLSELHYVQTLKEVGISRLSIGVQSAVQSELELFGRLHDAQTVVQAVENARRAGFNNLNLDLIYGNPKQTLAMWQYSLDQMIALNPDHFSLYALGLEPKTAMEYWVRNGKLAAPDEDLAADMYDLATDVLGNNGFHQYEISNWAKTGYESRHNIQYWRNHPYVGLGPGAHGYAGGIRYEVVRSPHKYIDIMSQVSSDDWRFPLTPAVEKTTQVSRDDEIAETIMMGMRLLHDGVSLSEFAQRFGENLLDIRQDSISQYRKLGFIEVTDDRIRFTNKGRLVSNRVLRDLI